MFSTLSSLSILRILKYNHYVQPNNLTYWMICLYITCNNKQNDCLFSSNLWKSNMKTNTWLYFLQSLIHVVFNLMNWLFFIGLSAQKRSSSLFRATWTGVNIARTRKLKYAISSRNTICLTKCPAGKNTTNYGKTVTFATTASQFPIIYSLLMQLVFEPT